MGQLRATSLALLAAAALASARPALADPEPPRHRGPILLSVAACSPVENIPLDHVRRVFSGDSRDFTVLNLPPGTSERIAVDLVLLGRLPRDVARYWIERKIRGQGGPPRVVASARLVTRIVARVPGTIGYVASGPLPPDVKAVRIDGLAHTDPRYPLMLRRRWR